MKRFEYVISGLLVIIGLGCLTTSGSYFIGTGIDAYIMTFLQVCMWSGIPLFVVGIIYFFLIRVRKEKNDKLR